jgi:hypothetical protein
MTVAAPSKAWTVFTCSTLWSWIRIPFEAWMFAFILCLCSPAWVGALRWADLLPKEYYQLSVWLRNCSLVGWGTMLQAGKSPVRVPNEVDFFSLPKPSSRTMALGSTQPLTEMSTRNLPGGRIRPSHRADNLAAICEPNVWKCESFNLSQPKGPPRPVQGKLYLFIMALQPFVGPWPLFQFLDFPIHRQ